MKKLVIYFLVVVLICNISGCGRTQKKEKTIVKEYLSESELTLPEGLNSCLDIYNNGNRELLIIGQSIKNGEFVWVSEDNGKNWKEKITLPKELRTSLITEAQFMEDGAIFCTLAYDALQRNSTEENVEVRYYYVTTDGEFERKLLETVEGFKEIIVKDYIVYGRDKNGTVKGWDCISEEIVNVLEHPQSFINQFVLLNDKVVTVELDGVESYDLETKENIKTEKNLQDKLFKLSAENGRLCFDEQNGRILYVGKKGVFEYRIEEECWNQLLHGNNHEFANPEGYLSDVSILKNGMLAISCVNSNMQAKTYLYKYEEEGIDVKQTFSMELYSLEKNDAIEELVNQFNAIQDEIYVEYEYDFQTIGNSTTDKNDAIKKINTRMMAGNGPDLLVLDGFNEKTYIEKGILYDESKILNKKENFVNIALPFTGKTGEVYGVPLYFQVMGIHADKEVVDSIDSFERFTEQLQKIDRKNPKITTIHDWDTSNYMEVFLLTYYEDLFEEGKISQKKLERFYENMKTIFDISEYAWEEEQEENKIRDLSYTSLSSNREQEILLAMNKVQVSVSGIINLENLSAVHSLCKEKNLEFSFYKKNGEMIFVPNTIISINNASSKQKEAEKFVEYCISERAYENAVSDYGFPIKKKALKELLSIPLGYTDEYQDSDGQTVKLTFETLSKTVKNEFLSAVDTTHACAYIDPVVKETIMVQAGNYINGKAKLEECVTTVTEKLNLYLQE